MKFANPLRVPKGQQISTVKLSHACALQTLEMNQIDRKQWFPRWPPPASNLMQTLISLFNFAKLQNFNAMLLNF